MADVVKLAEERLCRETIQAIRSISPERIREAGGLVKELLELETLAAGPVAPEEKAGLHKELEKKRGELRSMLYGAE